MDKDEIEISINTNKEIKKNILEQIKNAKILKERMDYVKELKIIDDNIIYYNNILKCISKYKY